ncbi:MAG: hypothetical protein Q7U28_02655 [Aquabacterium sp.]|nr:hypothetical protein [Aquabacterium sp.]
MGRKVAGFIAGFGGTLFLMALLGAWLGVRLRGSGWLFLMISAGMLGARLMTKPGPDDHLPPLPKMRSGPKDRFPPLFGTPPEDTSKAP